LGLGDGGARAIGRRSAPARPGNEPALLFEGVNLAQIDIHSQRLVLGVPDCFLVCDVPSLRGREVLLVLAVPPQSQLL
jgi:hypothetical protein